MIVIAGGGTGNTETQTRHLLLPVWWYSVQVVYCVLCAHVHSYVCVCVCVYLVEGSTR